MSKEEQIYKKALSLGIRENNYVSHSAIFFIGFKFEKSVSDDVCEYNAYNTRTMTYKKLSDTEMDFILNHGLFKASAKSSYTMYQKMIDRYNAIGLSKRTGQKTKEKAWRVSDEYNQKCLGILSKYPELLQL